MAYPLFQSLRAGLSAVRSARWAPSGRSWRLTVSAEPSAVEISGEAVTADYFKVLGLQRARRTYAHPRSDDGTARWPGHRGV